jgi:hypothetical protein
MKEKSGPLIYIMAKNSCEKVLYSRECLIPFSLMKLVRLKSF